MLAFGFGLDGALQLEHTVVQTLVGSLGLQQVDIGDAGFGLQIRLDQLKRAQQAVAQLRSFHTALGDFGLQLGNLLVDTSQGMFAFLSEDRSIDRLHRFHQASHLVQLVVGGGVLLNGLQLK
ncbi:hypothetical protein D9M69_512530 [compost metagenome]